MSDNTEKSTCVFLVIQNGKVKIPSVEPSTSDSGKEVTMTGKLSGIVETVS